MGVRMRFYFRPAADRMFSNWTVRRGLIVLTSVIAVGVIVMWRILRKRRTDLQSITSENVYQGQRKEPHERLNVSEYQISVVEDAQACEEYLATRLPNPLKIVGLDCEWRAQRLGGSVPVALLQLAFPNRECVLVRLCKVRDMTPKLAEILKDKSVLKFGVGISTDVKRLAAGFGVQSSGCVDLQHIAVRCGVRFNTSLQGLSNQLLGINLDKSPWLRCSNWEAETLSQDQINYAASDAIIALHILKALVETKFSKEDQQAAVGDTLYGSPDHYMQLKSTNTIDLGTSSNDEFTDVTCQCLCGEWLMQGGTYPSLISLCQGIVDVAYQQPRRMRQQQSGTIERKKSAAYSVRRTRLYHNCKLLAPDGQLLSTIDKRKLEWYLQKGLGTLVSESPMTVQLLFEPAGRPSEDRQYYLKQKENICVVCGTGDSCVRKNIVPHEYRKHFPPELKEHLSHDILLMCVQCHQMADLHDAALKQQLALETNAPLNVSAQKFKEDTWLVLVRNHARALLRSHDSIPECRKWELLDTVAQYCGCSAEDLTNDLIQEASEVNPKSETAGYVSHAELVVSQVREKGQLFEFQQRWRQHFLDTMQPRFLPDLWCVNHNPKP